MAAGVVQNVQDLMERDAQLAHRRHWVPLEHPEMGSTVYNAPPVRLSRTPARLSRPAPLLGEHTGEVCRDLLGMSAAQVAAEHSFDARARTLLELLSG